MEVDFEAVYSKYYPIVFRYVRSLSHSDDTAEEIAQETFYRALLSIDSYDPSMKLLTWLCAIAKNTYFSSLRRSRRTDALDDALPDGEGDIIDRLIDGEDSMEIYRLLHGLAEPYKEVFTLRTLGSLSFRQIAGIFGKTESWARVTYYRAKTQIKEKMDNA